MASARGKKDNRDKGENKNRVRPIMKNRQYGGYRQNADQDREKQAVNGTNG